MVWNTGSKLAKLEKANPEVWEALQSSPFFKEIETTRRIYQIWQNDAAVIPEEAKAKFASRIASQVAVEDKES